VLPLVQLIALLCPASGEIAEARIYDNHGLVGRAVQSLAVRRWEYRSCRA